MEYEVEEAVVEILTLSASDMIILKRKEKRVGSGKRVTIINIGRRICQSSISKINIHLKERIIMRKTFSFIPALLVTIMALFIFGNTTASASEKNIVESFETEELINLVSENNEEVSIPATVTLTSEETNPGLVEYTQTIDFDTQDATPKESNSNDNSLSLLDSFLFKKVQASGGGSNYVYGWDSTGGVKGNITVNYSIDNYGKYKITSVSGGYNIYDTATQILSQKVVIGCSGGGITQIKTYYPTASSWTLYPGFINYVKSNVLSIGGANNTLSLRRNSSNWTMTVQNIIFENGGIDLPR